MPEPRLTDGHWQLCTASQMEEPIYRQCCAYLREQPTKHRKQWEFVYILANLQAQGMLRPGARGLGFGCGKEPLAAVFAHLGCEVTATDLGVTEAAGKGWIETDQHASRLGDLNDRGICDPEVFRTRVRFVAQDMNRISYELRDFDFVWSSCAFEHLGSLRNGLQFVVQAMDCLKPGGLAIHTTEVNLTSNLETIESPDLSVYRKVDMESLRERLSLYGHRLPPLNLNPGSTILDRHVDLPPYRQDPHLRLLLGRYVATSIGLMIWRSQST
jgi:2-polyprenyl-3-methyl-5-hydroxy-6-metoxy-1,4-benzoquinol methylase